MTQIDTLKEVKQKDDSIKYYIRRRKFLGKTEDFDSKEEEKYEKKHLQAYLKGKEIFRFGYRAIKDGREPAFYKVQEGLMLIEISKEQAEAMKTKAESLKVKAKELVADGE